HLAKRSILMSEWFRPRPEASFPDGAFAGCGVDIKPKALPGKRLHITLGTTTCSTTEAESGYATPKPARSRHLYWSRPAHGRYMFPPAKLCKLTTVDCFPLRAIGGLSHPACSGTGWSQS